MFFTLVRRLRRSRRAHPEQLTDEDEDAIPSVETWNDASSRVLVTSNARDGTCTVSLRAKVGHASEGCPTAHYHHPSTTHVQVDLPPQQLYDVLTSPQNGVIFKGIKRVIDRRVVHAAPGRQTVDVTQEGQWRFLMFRGTFVTRLRVEEDRASHSVVFRQLSPGFMKAFEGRWQLSPFTQETLDEVFDVQHKHKWLGLRKALAAVEHGMLLLLYRALLY